MLGGRLIKSRSVDAFPVSVDVSEVVRGLALKRGVGEGSGAGGFEEDSAGGDHDAIRAGQEDGVSGDLRGGAGDVHVFVLEIDFQHGTGTDAELGETGIPFGTGILLAELGGGQGARSDVIKGDGAAAPAEGVAAVGERGADERLCLFTTPAGGVRGGQNAGDAPGPLETAGKRFRAEGGGKKCRSKKSKGGAQERQSVGHK